MVAGAFIVFFLEDKIPIAKSRIRMLAMTIFTRVSIQKTGSKKEVCKAIKNTLPMENFMIDFSVEKGFLGEIG